MKTDKLFDLIHSLTKSEKVYFSKFAKLHNSKKKQTEYLKLFQIISQLKEYDESLLRRKVGIGISKHLFQYKFNLYNQILKTLRIKYFDLSVDFELKNILMEIEILQRKKLESQAFDMLMHAKSQAVKYEKHSILNEILLKECQIMTWSSFAKQYVGNEENFLQKHIDFIRQTNKNEALWSELIIIYTQLIFFNFKNGNARNENLFEKINELHNHAISINLDQTPIIYRTRLNAIQYEYHIPKMDFKKVKEYTIIQLNLFSQNPHFIKEYQLIYLDAIYRKCLSELILNEIEDAKKSLQQYKNEYANTRLIDKRLEFRILQLEYNLSITGKFVPEKILRSINAILNSNISNVNSRAFFVYMAAFQLFLNQKYELSRSYLIKLQIESLDKVRYDVFLQSKLLNAIIAYETKDILSIDSQIRSLYRFLSRSKNNYKIETLLLHFIKDKIRNINNENEFIEELKILKKQIEKVVQEPTEKNILHLFSPIDWIDSQIESKSMLDIINSKRSDT